MKVQSNGSTSIDASSEEVLAGVREIVGQQMGISGETIREDHSLENDLGCDSNSRAGVS